ncbi:hypothetical protein AB205_0087920 [Aquarana catesbeiana]|uniref:BPTI/Kunitz inhibitor domain-containing protein n=1 Tax=Aquarana catesbeiana TaxID=8400 RepID=A0A2G9QLF1_AQUCT|nr:hypothetical protein AB205_0087920 [Aquarana catesbeiana]
MTTICSLAVIAASLLVVQFISISTAEVCDQPVAPGPCKMINNRYYYDQETKICTYFNYGGCQGNGNNFLTKEECERTCKSDKGPCEAYMPRYYFKHETQTCEDFIYGGCQGNGNNFKTKEECERTCK